MSAARPLPQGVLRNIPISPGGSIPPASQSLKISPYDSFNFTNGAGFAVRIIFNTQFSNVDLGVGATSAEDGGNGSALNLTVSYNVYNVANPTTPTATGCVQFGIGPLAVAMDASHLNPAPFAIPAGGQIQVSADGTYKVTWTFANGSPANVWSPAITPVHAGQNPVQNALAGANSQTLKYTFVTAALVQGGGTVKVGS